MNHGIVIRSFMPHRHKCAIFDHQLGMIEATFFKQPLMYRVYHGMALEYSTFADGTRHRLDDIRIVAVPQAWVAQDVLFFHHLLEVVWFFVLYGQQQEALFELLQVLYQQPFWDEDELFKRWFLCRIFTVIGVYPSDYDSFDPNFFGTISLPYGALAKICRNDTLITRELARWLRGCVATHPQSDLFKTIVW